jgi:hypothetical protein
MPYVIVDIEADGPIPGDYSMISLGAVVVEPVEGRRVAGRPCDALHRLDRGLLGRGAQVERHPEQVERVDVHVGGEPGDELALVSGDEVDDPAGDVARREDLAERHRGERP